MAFTIGYATETYSLGVATYSTTEKHKIIEGVYLYTALANDQIDRAEFYGRQSVNNSGGEVEIGVYDVTNSYAQVATVSVLPVGLVEQWYGEDFPAPVPLIEGNVYAVAFRFAANNVRMGSHYSSGNTSQSLLTGASPLADPFAKDSANGNIYGVKVIGSTAAAPTTATRNVTNTTPTGYQTVQTMAAGVNTSLGIFASNIITAEDNMQATLPSVVNGVTINIDAATGNYTLSKAEMTAAGGSIDVPIEYRAPSTNQVSSTVLTIDTNTAPAGDFKSIVKAIKQSIKKDILQ